MLEERRLLSATVALFTGGNGTSSADQYTGTSGSGWSTAWTQLTTSDTINTATVVSTSPLNGGGNYLSLSDTSSASAGESAVSRAYSTTDDLDTGALHTLSFDYRLDSSLTPFTGFNDRVGFFGDSSAADNTSGSNTWTISAFGGTFGSSTPAKTWGFLDGTKNGASGTWVSAGIPLTQNTIYHFDVTIDPVNQSYSVSMNDGQSGAGHGYSSGTLGFRTGNAFTSSTSTYLNCITKHSASGTVVSGSIDSITITGIPPAPPATETDALFTDGNGTTSADQYTGTSGSGWSNAWASSTTNDTINV